MTDTIKLIYNTHNEVQNPKSPRTFIFTIKWNIQENNKVKKINKFKAQRLKETNKILSLNGIKSL
jgi:hypothetical protein